MSPYARGYVQKFFNNEYNTPFTPGTIQHKRFKEGCLAAEKQLKAFTYMSG